MEAKDGQETKQNGTGPLAETGQPAGDPPPLDENVKENIRLREKGIFVIGGREFGQGSTVRIVDAYSETGRFRIECLSGCAGTITGASDRTPESVCLMVPDGPTAKRTGPKPIRLCMHDRVEYADTGGQ